MYRDEIGGIKIKMKTDIFLNPCDVSKNSFILTTYKTMYIV